MIFISIFFFLYDNVFPTEQGVGRRLAMYTGHLLATDFENFLTRTVRLHFMALDRVSKKVRQT